MTSGLTHLSFTVNYLMLVREANAQVPGWVVSISLNSNEGRERDTD